MLNHDLLPKVNTYTNKHITNRALNGHWIDNISINAHYLQNTKDRFAKYDFYITLTEYETPYKKTLALNICTLSIFTAFRMKKLHLSVK